MSSKTGWPQDYMNPRIMQAHEAFVDMLHGRTKFSILDALSLTLSVDEEQDGSDASESDVRQTEVYCGLSRNFLHRSRPRIAVVAGQRISRQAVQQAVQHAVQKAEKSAEELIEEEERLKRKAEKKRLKKMRQKEKKRQEKQEKGNANEAKENQGKGGGIKNKKENKKCTESPDSGKHGNSDDGSDERDEDDEDSISNEKECRKMKKQPGKEGKKSYNKTNDKQTIDNNEAVSINKKIKNKKLDDVRPDDGPQCSSEASSDEDDYSDEEKENAHSDLEELDMSSCFVSSAAATIAKRKLEKAKEKKEKRDKKAGDSGKDSQKPDTEQQNSKTHKEVPPPPSQNNVKTNPEKNITDLVTRSMELAFIGNQYAANGNLEMAVKYFTDAIMHNPREYKLFGNRSFCFEKMEQYEKALMDANVALSMNPQWVKGLYRKGRALSGLKRFLEAMGVYKEVLTLDNSCADAAQELIKVQILQLMEMGFTREQSTNAMIVHGSVEKALDALSGLQGTYIPVGTPSVQEEWMRVEKRSQSPKPAAPPPARQAQQPIPAFQPPSQAPPQPKPVQPELFPVWVGCPPQVLTEAFIYDLFRQVGRVHSVKVLRNKNCAFVNYIHREDCERAITKLHGIIVAGGFPLVVRFPDRIHPHLGVSKGAVTELKDKLPDECYFWRNTGCIKNQSCPYRHIPENKGIDRSKAK
ncbi:hypothetical protein ACEWY4_005729 [Coilia grayii]|uniref:Tetratricopeptide repeat protein 31 n=1 Tax=Coilia grayii TaxID=363190 RepID=A0ABD1KJ98_9TELE